MLPGAVRRDQAVEAWFDRRDDELGTIAKGWFDVMRACGEDVREILHDGHPTACVDEAAFCYVNAFTSHVNIGFFLGAFLDDPDRLLEGTGRFMRHIKVRPGESTDYAAVRSLIEAACDDMRQKVKAEEER